MGSRNTTTRCSSRASRTHSRSIIAASAPFDGTARITPRNVAQHRHRVVVVEMPAEALLIAQPGNPQHHRIGELPVGKERQRRRLAPDLVLGIVQIGQELDLRHRHEAVLRHADGKAQDRLLVQQRVDHPVRPEARLQLLRHAIDAALAAHILAHHHDFGVGQHQVGQRPVDDAATSVCGSSIAFMSPPKAAARASAVGPLRGLAGALRRDQAGHHIAGRLQPRPRHRLGGNPRHPGAGLRDRSPAPASGAIAPA